MESNAGGTLPLEYRVASRTRFTFCLIATVLLAAWVALFRVALAADRVMQDIAFLSGVGLVALVILYFAAYAMFGRLIVRADAIELRNPFVSRVMFLHELAGTRNTHLKSGIYVRFVAKSGSVLRAHMPFVTDGRYNAWISSLPDLDAVDRLASRTAAEADRRLGTDSTSRLARLEQVGRRIKLVNGVVVALVLWSLLFPTPYRAVIVTMALLPWLAWAIARFSNGLVRLDGDKANVYPSVLQMVLLPPALLLIRLLVDWRVLDLAPAAKWGMVVGLPLAATLIWATRKAPTARWARVTGYALVAWMYGFALLALANVQLDSAPPQVFQTTVLGKHVSHRRLAAYEVSLSRWGPIADGETVKVSSRLYERLSPGDRICMHLQPGAFGMRWAWPGVCENSPALTR
jgi:hypothetical protein